MRRTDVEKTKEILRLHDKLGLSQREIAAATGCSLGTVSSTLSKAKAADITYPVETSLTPKTACKSRSAASSQSCGTASSSPSRRYARQHWRSWTG